MSACIWVCMHDCWAQCNGRVFTAGGLRTAAAVLSAAQSSSTSSPYRCAQDRHALDYRSVRLVLVAIVTGLRDRAGLQTQSRHRPVSTEKHLRIPSQRYQSPEDAPWSEMPSFHRAAIKSTRHVERLVQMLDPHASGLYARTQARALQRSCQALLPLGSRDRRSPLSQATSAKSHPHLRSAPNPCKKKGLGRLLRQVEKR